MLVSGNYQSGISVVDFTDPANATEVGFADPDPLVPTQLGGDWSTYWYNDRIYDSDITRGLLIWNLSDRAMAAPSASPTSTRRPRNSTSAEDLWQGGHPRIRGPAAPLVWPISSYIRLFPATSGRGGRTGVIAGVHQHVNAEPAQRRDRSSGVVLASDGGEAGGGGQRQVPLGGAGHDGGPQRDARRSAGEGSHILRRYPGGYCE